MLSEVIKSMPIQCHNQERTIVAGDFNTLADIYYTNNEVNRYMNGQL